MDDEEMERISRIISDLVLRVGALEKLLVRKQLLTEQEITTELKAMNEQLFAMVKAQLSALQGTANDKEKVEEKDATTVS